MREHGRKKTKRYKKLIRGWENKRIPLKNLIRQERENSLKRKVREYGRKKRQ